ncbi:MAG: hypothetical protein GEU79_15320 [Acidimicrobiia bacterium]|nr:hypothetical protein [Acidimicrobiia bacterium]
MGRRARQVGIGMDVHPPTASRPDPTEMTALYLVRHGETTLNTQGRFRGHTDPALNRRGRRQAREAGRQLAPVRPEAIYSSPLRRAVETAEAIAQQAGLDVITSPDLIDIDYGTWEGLTPAQAAVLNPEAYTAFRSDPLSATPPGGEAVKHVEIRTLRALEVHAKTHPRANIVAVSHEMPIRLALGAILGKTDDHIWGLDIPTASTTRIETVNDRFHLRQE